MLVLAGLGDVAHPLDRLVVRLLEDLEEAHVQARGGEQEVQDQEREVQSESVEDCEEVQEEVQEGPQEGTAPVPEDLLRARLADLLMPFHQVRAGYRSGDLPLSPRFELLSRTGSSYPSAAAGCV